MRSVLLIDLGYGGRVPRELTNVLELMGWDPIRPGVAYVLDWEEALDAPCPGGVWDRIETPLAVAKQIGLRHRILTMRRGEKIPLDA